MTILEEANSDIIGDIKNGITKQKLKEENEKLIEEIECRKSTTDSEIAELNGEIKLLKEQIDKLKKPKKTITCSSCGQTGHNKTSKKCPNVIDA